MGLYPDHVVTRFKAAGTKWFATATTVAEAKAAQDAGADAIIAQGMEAEGHRGAFDASEAEARLVGPFSLLPAVVDAVNTPVIAGGRHCGWPRHGCGSAARPLCRALG
jgi:nitronate monooxygenase